MGNFLGIGLKRRALSGNNREWACTTQREMNIVGISHCAVNFEVAEAPVHAVSPEREAKY
jgi:hypothetical protein